MGVGLGVVTIRVRRFPISKVIRHKIVFIYV